MNWKQTFFKPKWQNSNADIRLESVSTDQHPDLFSSLLKIAGDDTDVRVRCAAIKRLHRLENILKLKKNEKDPQARKLLNERIRQLASSSDESRPPLEVRMQVVESTSDRDLIEHLAAHAPEAQLRRAALTRVKRQGVIGDCCINDPDAENRSFAAGLVTQHTTLKRVIDAVRKSDKSLHAKLQERLHKEQLEQADPAAVQTEAIRICSALEKQALAGDDRDSTEIDKLHAAWQRIEPHTRDEMNQRYQRACERLFAPPVVPEPSDLIPVSEIEAATRITVATEAAAKPDEPHQPDETLSRLAASIGIYETENTENPGAKSITKLRQQLEKAWKRCSPPHPDDLTHYETASAVLEKLESTLEARRKQDEKELDHAKELVTQLETELEQGELHKALETRAKLQQLIKGRGKNRAWQQLNNKLNSKQSRLRELRDWLHWSNNKIRKRLIAEMEVLPSADLHPDALLDRIKSLQQEWKNLEQSEQIPGDKKFSAAPWMWRKFSAAGHAAFDTAKPFLDKRSEIQSRHAQSLATFCAELEQLTQAEPIDWTALGKGLSRGRRKLQDLNTVPPKQRQKLARKLKAALNKANTVLQANYEVVELEKMKLIRAASQLAHLPERSEAISQAKALQSSWKAAGSLWRSKEQELWNQFREHIDPLFAELKNEQASIRAADKDRLAAQKALCAEMKDIVNSKDDLTSLHGKVQGLQDSWKDIEHPDRRLQMSFQELVAKYEKRVTEAEKSEVAKNRERWWLKSALLHELAVSGRTARGALSKKTEAKVTADWPSESSDDGLEQRMDQICKDILDGKASKPDDGEIGKQRERARALCISLEFLAGMPSPEEDRDQRMKYQVDRLAESMSGDRARQPATEEALEAEKTWLGLYTLPETDYETFGKRIKHALSTILDNV